ncbi:MAG: endonuclease MutS2 [Firmicutes bacterium]|nr:endonuclease MutS2 [Bacillota bacterium]
MDITKQLEFDVVLQKVADFCYTSSGKNGILEIKPNASFSVAKGLLEYTSEAHRLLNVNLVNPLDTLDDVAVVLQKLSVKQRLSISEILGAARLLAVSAKAKQAIVGGGISSKVPLLSKLVENIAIYKDIETQIDNTILDENTLKDTASALLSKLRKDIKATQNKVKEKLQQIVKSNAKFLQDQLVTLRGDRFVIPVKVEHKREVQGLVHDTSSGGATLFVEPLAVVELNNEIKTLAALEAQECERILAELSTALSNIVDCLKQNEKIIVRLDIIFAKAHYANATKASAPRLNDKGIINLKSARHPLLDVARVVPIDISILPGADILVITGPNTGGKTVALKTVGLLCLMASVGMFIPCYDESETAVFDAVYADIGDAQSIEYNLSTFSSHMSNIVRILASTDSTASQTNKNKGSKGGKDSKAQSGKALILLDELGSGTSPYEGAALAVAITKHLLSTNCKAIITSHYTEMKEFSLQTPRIEKAAMEFCPKTFLPTYRLVMGQAGSSNALEISKNLGLSTAIIDTAKGLLNSERVKLDKIIAAAQSAEFKANKARQEAESLRADLAKSLAQTKAQHTKLLESEQKLLATAKTEAKRIKQDAAQQATDIIKEVSALTKSHNAKDIFKAREIKNQLLKESIEVYEPPTLDMADYTESKIYAAGDTVYVKSLQAVGQVISASGKQVVVSVNNMQMRFKVGDLLKRKANVAGAGASTSRASSNNSNLNASSAKKANSNLKAPAKNRVAGEVDEIDINAKDLNIQAELNLLGYSVLDAQIEFDSFLRECDLAGHKLIRIIHGTGTGALRKGLTDYFKRYKRIKEFRLGRIYEGDTGATIIVLR